MLLTEFTGLLLNAGSHLQLVYCLGNTRDDFKSPGDKDGLGINYWGAEEGRRLISPELREDALSVKSNLEVKCFPKHSEGWPRRP